MKLLIAALAGVVCASTCAYAKDVTYDPELPIVCNIQPPSITPGSLPPHIEQKLRQKDQAAIDANKGFCDQQRKELAEKRARQRQTAEAQKKAMEEEAKRLAEQRAREVEASRFREIEMQKPENRLFRAYGLFARVQFCYQVRNGYAVVWISEPEYERSHTAVKAVEAASRVSAYGSPDARTAMSTSTAGRPATRRL